MSKKNQLVKMTIKEQKQCLLDIVKYIDQICIDNDIRYSMMFGTLLGAVRHHGFIPWDDDIDLALPREDYDKLKNVMQRNQSDRFVFVDNINDQKYALPWAKIIDNRTYLTENGVRLSDDYGLFVDIFPYDQLPLKHQFIDKIKKQLLNQLINGIRHPLTGGSKARKIYRLMRFRIAHFIGKRWIVDKYDYLCRKNNTNNNENIASVHVDDYNKTIKIKEFDNLCRMEFESIKLNAFQNYDLILTDYFGNYMKLPPENERISHGLDAYWK